MKLPLLLVGLVLVAGCVGTSGGVAMIVENGDHVSVHYAGMLDNGTVFDSSEGREPLEFDVGSGQVIAGFDEAVIGMKAGQEKTVRIEPSDAYGERSDENIIEVPIENVPEGTKQGSTLFAQGQPVVVIAINETVATIDANHPLAGKTLTFKITLVTVDKA